jgi:hypothetical protein
MSLKKNAEPSAQQAFARDISDLERFGRPKNDLGHSSSTFTRPIIPPPPIDAHQNANTASPRRRNSF